MKLQQTHAEAGVSPEDSKIQATPAHAAAEGGKPDAQAQGGCCGGGCR